MSSDIEGPSPSRQKFRGQAMSMRLIIGCGLVLFFGLGLRAQEPPPLGNYPLSNVKLPDFSVPPQSSLPLPSLISSSVPSGFPDSLPFSFSPSSGNHSESQSLPSSQGPEPASSLTLRDRFRIYLKSYSDPTFLFFPPIAAGYDQWINNPPEWGRTFEGFGRRLGSGFTRDTISHTLKAGVAAADHEDPRVSYSPVRRFWPRAHYALRRTFIAPRDGGGETIAFSTIIGNYGSAFVSNTWYPKPYATVGHALGRGTSSLAIDVLVNELHEFNPSLRGWCHRHLGWGNKIVPTQIL